MTALRLITSRPLRRSVCPLTVTGTTLHHVPTGLHYRLPWHHARCLAEAIHQTLDGPAQVAAAGFVVRRVGKFFLLDGAAFDLPLVQLTRMQAVYLGTELARVRRLGVVGD